MRILTRAEEERQAREFRHLRQEVRNVNADRASIAIDLVTCRKWLDGWRDRALKAEEACRLLAAENDRLNRQSKRADTSVKEST